MVIIAGLAVLLLSSAWVDEGDAQPMLSTSIQAQSCLSVGVSSSADDAPDMPSSTELGIDHVFSTAKLGGHVTSVTSLGGGLRMGLSANGSFVALQLRCENLGENTYQVGWYVLDLRTDDVAPTFIGDAGDPLLFRGRQGERVNGAWMPHNPQWSPDSRWVAYLRSDGGRTQVWRSSVDGRVQEQLTHSEADVEAFYWSDDGSEIWFETDVSPEGRRDYLEGVWQSGLSARNERFWPLTQSYRARPYSAIGGQPTLWIGDLASGSVRMATQEEAEWHFARYPVTIRELFVAASRSSAHPDRAGTLRYTPMTDGTAAAWFEVSEQGLQLKVQTNAGASSISVCMHSQCSGPLDGLFWSQSAPEIVFARREGEGLRYNVIYAWNFETDSIRQIYTEDNRHLTACSSTGASLICFSDNATHPRVLVEVQFEDGALTQLFNPNPWFEDVSVGDAELITWENEFGISAMGWLIRPVGYQADGRYPLVIVQYNAQLCFSGGTGREHPAQLYANQGIMVLCMNQPGSRPPDENGEGGDTYHRRSSVVSSWESIIGNLAERGDIDPDRVGVTGFSAGADNMSYGLSRTNIFSSAIMAWMPFSPLSYYSAQEGRFGKERMRRAGTGRWGTSDGRNLENMSLGLNAEHVNTPILVQVSDNELMGTIFNYVTLNEEDVPIDMYVFRDEYHSKWWPQNRYAAIERSLAWMQFWLQGEVDPDTMSEAQLEHWLGLCEQQIARLAASDDPVLQARATNQPCASVSANLQ